MSENNSVSHPAHYTFGNIEVIDALDDWNLPFCLANVVKYVVRAGRKKEQGMTDTQKKIQDLQKAEWYLSHFIEYAKRNSEHE